MIIKDAKNTYNTIFFSFCFVFFWPGCVSFSGLISAQLNPIQSLSAFRSRFLRLLVPVCFPAISSVFPHRLLLVFLCVPCGVLLIFLNESRFFFGLFSEVLKSS